LPGGIAPAGGVVFVGPGLVDAPFAAPSATDGGALEPPHPIGIMSTTHPKAEKVFRTV